jgi:dihydrofolate synthase/folylpolyglutamate synthase
VVWETGLGGRLDATNIVRPKVCIITNIGLDHQQYLGQTLGEIAAEKAGILKPGVPVISAVKPGEAAEVIDVAAERLGASLFRVSRDFAVEDRGWREGRQRARIDGVDFTLGLIGSHQVENAACAVAALRQAEVGGRMSGDVLGRGLKSTSWPGRFEILSEAPLMVLDGAHNPAGVRRLIETWRAFLAARGIGNVSSGIAPTHLVFASVADKDVTEIAELFRPVASEVSLVRLANERTADPRMLAGHFAGKPCRIYDSVPELMRELRAAPKERPVLVTGSLFLAGEVLAQRAAGGAEEYRLNERLESSAGLR